MKYDIGPALTAAREYLVGYKQVTPTCAKAALLVRFAWEIAETHAVGSARNFCELSILGLPYTAWLGHELVSELYEIEASVKQRTFIRPEAFLSIESKLMSKWEEVQELATQQGYV